MERRQVDLGLSEILERVRASEENRGPRRSRMQPKREDQLRGAKGGQKRKQRPGKKERKQKLRIKN
jgi:uncharacterized protein (DUF2225 family)